jgi:K+-transporting ATPase KdpF subunit
MSAMLIVASVLAVALFIYLFIALFDAERLS